MHDETIIFSIFLIFAGAALLATIALYLRQAMLIAYLALGIILGPGTLGLVSDATLIQEIARIAKQAQVLSARSSDRPSMPSFRKISFLRSITL